MANPILVPAEVRMMIFDSPENNHLLDGEEFPDMIIDMAMQLAISDFNSYAPISGFDAINFPNKSCLMSGTLYKLFYTKSAHLARNTMEYSDGGIQIPVEERAELYFRLSSEYEKDFRSTTIRLKTAANIEDGWGEVQSDYATFPLW